MDRETRIHEYVEWLHHWDCTVCHDHVFVYGSEAHHVIPKGMGGRSPDWFGHWLRVPLCRTCHIEYHTIGCKTFEKKHDVDLVEDAWDYLERYCAQ